MIWNNISVVSKSLKCSMLPPIRHFKISTSVYSSKEEAMKKRQAELMKKGLPKRKTIEGVQHVILVSSGKGGVGKSTTAVNLSLALSKLSSSPKVSLLDADIFGPSIPTMMNISELPLLDSKDKMLPVMNYGVGCMSMGLLVDPNSAVVWRGPMVMGALDKMVHGTNWSGTDVLVVDLPPGTGDIHLSISQTVEIAGAVVVSTPQKVALADARKGVDMFNKVGIPVLGVVQNMSSFVCGKCGEKTHVFGCDGAQRMAQELGVSLLGDVPLDPALMSSSDSGKPIVMTHPDSEISQTYQSIAQQIIDKLR
eukprot:GFUD01019367.1.p1 GENE.GFUD01019367.1~~GFUD01019367.1.p1  ORF type:complete len:309 (-),score=110.32 GFUD01019367.1:42-968(-)